MISLRFGIGFAALVGILVCARALPAQTSGPSAPEQDNRRILGIMPNYSTGPDRSAPFQPLTTREKFHLATQSTFDPGTFVLSAIYTGISQAENQYPEWGQGAAGFGKRYAAALTGLVTGDYLAGAILPTLLHQDPRYFRLAQGTVLHRTVYAMSRIFVIRSDSGKDVANWSELAGNAGSAAIATTYYPSSSRTVGDAASQWGFQVGTDALLNVVKEFWPDIHRKISKK
jgi:hypothetical protein